MTPDEIDLAVNRLAGSFRGRIGKAGREAWGAALAPLDRAAVTAGIDHLARTEERMPSIAAVCQAATRHDKSATGSPASFQVLVTWTDPSGLAFAQPTRWHDNEPDARADYQDALGWAARHDNGHVELIRYDEGRPPRTIEQSA